MYKERAAIMEFEGGLNRQAAEIAARAICMKKPETASLRNSANRQFGPGYEAFRNALKRR